MSSTPDRLARARMHVLCTPAAIEGQQGRTKTFRLAAELVHGFCLADEEALELLRLYNQRCRPPWGDSDLEERLEKAREEGAAYIDPELRNQELAREFLAEIEKRRPIPKPVSVRSTLNPQPKSL